MTNQITKPEVEALINQRLQSGVYEDAEDVILQALRCLPAKQPSTPHLDRSLQEVFEPSEAWRMTLNSAAIRPPGVRSI